MCFQEKIARAARIERQRDMVRDALSSVRREMMRQEEAFKKQLDQAKFISFDDYDLSNVSTLISSLNSVSRPKTAHGRLELVPSGNSLESNISETIFMDRDEDQDIQERAQQMKKEIDQELMREMGERLESDNDVQDGTAIVQCS